MAGLANTYFNKQPVNEQTLIQGLVTECIQVVGFNVYYLPRQLQNFDLVFGEDVTSKFDTYLEIEMYQDSFEGWQGQSELISKFGLEIRNQIVFKVSVSRWATEVTSIADKMWVPDRPQEGDLIYDPITAKLFEIKFIDQDWQFSQLGKQTYAYKMTCEMYQFSDDVANTGIAELDNSINLFATNPYDMQVLTEAGGLLLQENGSAILFEVGEAAIDKYDTSSQFATESAIAKFNVDNPFNDII